MPIHVLNKKTYSQATYPVFIDPTRVIYVGRPSALGNPFSHLDRPDLIKVASRQEAVDEFAKMLNEHRLSGEYAGVPHGLWLSVLELVDRIKQEPDEEWGLMCWCAPEACHAGVIKRAIEWVMAGMPKKGE